MTIMRPIMRPIMAAVSRSPMVILARELIPDGPWLAASDAILSENLDRSVRVRTGAADNFGIAYKIVPGFVVGKRYRVKVWVERMSGGTVQMRLGTGAATSIGDVVENTGADQGFREAVFVAPQTSLTLGLGVSFSSFNADARFLQASIRRA